MRTKQVIERNVRTAWNFSEVYDFGHKIEESLKKDLKNLIKRQNITR